MDYKKDFPMLNKDIIYLDNCATTLKPYSVINEISNYYENYSSNASRGDYDISLLVDEKIDETRVKVKDFLNAKDKKEIIFTSGTTAGLNMVIKGFFRKYLNSGDEVLTTKAEHASLLLPLFEIAKEKDIKINYIELESDMSVTLENVEKAITKNTKLIAISHITNVIGDMRPIGDIIKIAHKNNILTLIDGAQSVPHKKIDVSALDIDFICFSSHKMLGPTGLGILYGKEKLLNDMEPIMLGGGMNAYFDGLMNVEYKNIPEKFEAGTLNISAITSFSKAMDYINNVGINNIEDYEINLKKYAIDKLSKLKNITIYNKDTKNGIITFNVDNVFAQDLAVYLNKKNICIRVGNHCAKALSEVLGVKNTCRASLYFYNTKDDIDKLVEALDNDNILYESL